MKTALGAALFAGARYNDAARQLCAASDLDPADAQIYLLIGKVMLASPEPLTCVKARIERFLAVRPNDADAHYLLAMLLLRQEGEVDTTRVTALLREAVQLYPKYSEAFLQLGILAFNQQRYADAIELYTRAISVDPQQAEPHFRLGVAYERMAKPMEARREFARHDELVHSQAEAVEQQRRQVKQFVILLRGKPDGVNAP